MGRADSWGTTQPAVLQYHGLRVHKLIRTARREMGGNRRTALYVVKRDNWDDPNFIPLVFRTYREMVEAFELGKRKSKRKQRKRIL